MDGVPELTPEDLSEFFHNLTYEALEKINFQTITFINYIRFDFCKKTRKIRHKLLRN